MKAHGTLEVYLRTAARLREEVDRSGRFLWSLVRRQLPATDRDDDVQARLRVALDLLGLELASGPWRVRRRARPPGPLDRAILLRHAFADRVFGRVEDIDAEAFRQLVDGERAARPMTALGQALESVGFRPPGSWRMFRGRPRLEIGDVVRLRLDSAAPQLAIARERAASRPKGPAADELLRRHFPAFERYTCGSQRDVIRDLLDEHGPRNVLARIPTGWGKSLLYLLPVAEWKRRGEPHTAIVVSPIVALQNDQVAKIMGAHARTGLIGREINSTVSPEERTRTYRALRRGGIDVLFLSPERLGDPFFREILESAAEHVRLLVVDEAHIVDAWGEDFRPEFWRLGRERERLLSRATDLRSLFLSATLTTHGEDVIRDVFALREELSCYVEPHVRRELSTRVVRCRNIDERFARLDALVRQVPKPCIVYFNRVKHARDARKRLHAQGMRRLFDYVGATGADARRERLRWFHDGDADVVLATNAFGLGIDKHDVRTIIHFDVPHSLDAYYQELGRAGRDGMTAHGILLATGGSLATVTRDNLAKLKTETAQERAVAMLSSRKELRLDGPGACLVPVHARREDIPADSPLNQMWNRVVLNTLERIGAITVDGVVPRRLWLGRGDNKRTLATSTVFAGVLPRGRRPVRVDLLALSRRAKAPFAAVAKETVRLILGRALEWDTSRDENDVWMLVHRNGTTTWSRDHTRRLEELREARMRRARDENAELRRFLRARTCRMTMLGGLYGITRLPPCGHCDICDPRLS